ncbi:MAG: iron chaperone [Actinomycetota bacterium]
MAEKKTAKKSAKKSGASVGFTAEERAAMKEHAAELKAAARGADGEKAVLATIAKMPEPDRGMGKRLHELVKASAPTLTPKTWYGMPAYANKDGKVVCFFRGASKFKERYAMLGFNDSANLDDGSMWPIAFALKKLSDAEEKKISALVKKAVR